MVQPASPSPLRFLSTTQQIVIKSHHKSNHTVHAYVMLHFHMALVVLVDTLRVYRSQEVKRQFNQFDFRMSLISAVMVRVVVKHANEFTLYDYLLRQCLILFTTAVVQDAAHGATRTICRRQVFMCSFDCLKLDGFT
jgi:hypothetical protein